VKPVALDTFQLQFLGDRKNTCDLRQFGVESSVETQALNRSDGSKGGRRQPYDAF
jgi:hypothetical protein